MINLIQISPRLPPSRKDASGGGRQDGPSGRHKNAIIPDVLDGEKPADQTAPPSEPAAAPIPIPPAQRPWGRHDAFLALFALYLLFAAFHHKDFGATWDESDVYGYGASLHTHYTTPQDRGMLFKFKHAESDVSHCWVYPALLRVLNPSSNLDFHHFLNMLFSSIFFLAAYAMLLKHFEGNGLAAFCGPLFILLTPGLFGHFAANPKDMPFAVAYLCALMAIYAFGGKSHTAVKVLVLGTFFGFAQSLRVVGFTLIVTWMLYEIALRWEGWRNSARYALRMLPTFFNVLFVSFFVMVLCWPYLGANFFLNLKDVLFDSSKFPWTNSMRYFGKGVDAVQLPWHYLPVWLAITIPVFILFHFTMAFAAISRRWPLFHLLALCLIVNAVLYLALKPVIYDGCRHYLFLLPVIAVLASLSFVEFWRHWRSRILGKTVLALSLLSMGLTAYDMAALHPYQYVYFNDLIGGLKGADGKFETDYWGATYKEAVEWLKKNECTDQKRVYKLQTTGNSWLSKVYFSANMDSGGDKDADYFVSFTRWDQHRREGLTPLHVIKRQGVPLNYIYKLKNESKNLAPRRNGAKGKRGLVEPSTFSGRTESSAGIGL